MREFGYERAFDVSGAVALLGADPDARYLGGGTNLVDLMKSGWSGPRASSTYVNSRLTESSSRTAASCGSARP